MEKQQLAPDPGPQRRKSKPVSSLGLLRAVLVVFGASGVLLAVWIAGKIGLQFVDKLKPPHLALYQNETWDQVTNRSTVVRPLVSGGDRFDILATQAAYQADRWWKTRNSPISNREIRVSKSNIGQLSMWFDEGVRPTKAQDDIFEVALYSGVIIQNATLSDKGLTAAVPLEFPLGVFLEQNLTAEHLRASFVVSPSVKMDHLRNFSSWMPDYVLENSVAFSSCIKSLIDRAIDSFSLSVPMIEFHPIVSHCDVMTQRPLVSLILRRHTINPGAQTQGGILILHLRILNEQHLFNLEAYNTVHNKLQRTSCGLGYNLGKALLHRSVCSRTYEEVGPMETRLEFSDSHHEETEWAYAPFLSAALNAAGPLDYIPVPVNRVNCSAQASYNSTNLPVLEPSSPEWYRLTAFAPVINASQSELERIEAQVQFEHQNTLRAHRFHIDSHPRRRLVAYTLGRLPIRLFALLLDVVYYRRLILTVGISIRGQWLSIASFLPGHWRGFTRLPATFAHATHAERASSRIDAKSSWRFIGTSMLILAMCLFLADPFQRDLIPSPLPPDPEATARSTAGNILSARMYKAAVWLMVAERVLHFTVYLPAILGRIPDSAPLSLGTVIKVLPLLMQAWQAMDITPQPKQRKDEEHEN
ncbi:hypothetical protein B0H14DRAFT_2912264 [Mycena olivaceomarginata]|nr:hypothetical protein B0H14DRAFT_2912264 [Mycena olivaceomarginata]